MQAYATDVKCRLISGSLITRIAWDDGSSVVLAMSTESIRAVDRWHGGMQLSECPKYDVTTLFETVSTGRATNE